MSFRLFILNLFLLLTFAVNAQGFRARHFLPNAGAHMTKAVFEVSPGNYIAGGIVVETVNNVQCNRICIMGLDALGQIQWTKKLGNSKFNYLNNNMVSKMFYKKDNFLYFVGCAKDSNNLTQGVLIKFNMSGDTIWRRIYRDPDPLEDVIPQMVTIGVDGGFLITGFFQNNGNSPYNRLMIIKTSADGEELWRKKLSKTSPDVQDGKSILQHSGTKKIVMTGYQYVGASGSIYQNLVVTDSLGGNVVRYTFPGNGGSLYDAIETTDGKVIAVGLVYTTQTLGGDFLRRSHAIKFDVDTPFPLIWQQTFGQWGLTNQFSSVSSLPNGDVVIGGYYDTLQLTNQPMDVVTRIVKISSTGSVTSNRLYSYRPGGPDTESLLAPHTIEPTSDNGLVAAIEGYNFPGANPFFFVKYDGTGCDSTLAYCQNIPTTGINNQVFGDVRVLCFPNPVKDRLEVQIEANTKLKFMLLVNDVAGRALMKNEVSDGQNNVYLTGLLPGFYILSIMQNGEVIYKAKLVTE